MSDYPLFSSLFFICCVGQVHKKHDSSKNNTPRTQRSKITISEKSAAAGTNTTTAIPSFIPQTPGNASVLDSLTGGSDLWKPLNYKI